MQKGLFENMNPALQLIFMLVVVLVSFFVITIAGVILAIPFTGVDGILNGLLSGSAGFMRYLQIIQSLAIFVVPPLLLAWLFATQPLRWLSFRRPVPVLLIIAILLFAVCQPFISWTGQINSNMQFPPFMQGIEEWMRTMEETNSGLVYKMLDTDNWGIIVLNSFMIALLPAFGEEMLFRGTLQPLLQKITKNPHWAVWITAFIFSTIHIQFLTFLPRLILGALLGYLLVYGKSLWYSITGHFLNNLASLVLFYYYKHTQPDINPMTADIEGFGWPAAAVSIVLTGVLFYIFVRKQNPHTK